MKNKKNKPENNFKKYLFLSLDGSISLENEQRIDLTCDLKVFI
jgi:hypothetical protein